MNIMVELVEFIINNVGKLIVLSAALGVSVFFVIRFAKEMRFNARLRKFQSLRRAPTSVFKRMRIAYFAGLVMVPLIFMVAFVHVIRVPHMRSPDYVLRIEDYEKLMDIYDNYNRNFSGGYVRFYDTSSLPFDDTVSKETETPLSVTLSNIDTVAAVGNRLYVLDDDGFRVFDTDTAESTLIPKDTIAFAWGDVETNRLFVPLGISADDNHIIVVIHEYKATATNITGEEPFNPQHQKAQRVHIQIFDREANYAMVKHYNIDGFLKAFDVQGGRLVLAVHEKLAMDGTMSWEDDFPAVVLNGVKQTPHYEDIMYVVGTNPVGFTSIVSLDLEFSEDIRHFVVFGDGSQRILILDEALIMLSRSHDFNNTSELFAISDPVAALQTGITIFALQEGIDHVQTFMVKGWLSTYNAVDFYEDTLRLLTTDKQKKHRLYRIDTQLDLVTDSLPATLEAIENARFDGQRVYVSAPSIAQPLHILDIDDDGGIHITLLEEHPGFSPYFFALGHSRFLSIDLNMTQDGAVSGLELQLHLATEDGIESLGDAVHFTAEGPFMMPVFSHAKALSYAPDHDMLVLSMTMLSASPAKPSGLQVYTLENNRLVDGGYITHSVADNRAFYRVLFDDHRMFVVSPTTVTVEDIDGQ